MGNVKNWSGQGVINCGILFLVHTKKNDGFLTGKNNLL